MSYADVIARNSTLTLSFDILILFNDNFMVFFSYRDEQGRRKVAGEIMYSKKKDYYYVLSILISSQILMTLSMIFLI